MVYRTPGFSVWKRISKTEACSYFLFGLLPSFKRVGRSMVNDPCRSALEYSLAEKCSTLSENDIFIDFI